MSHTLTEGGQITSHRLRMLRQVIKIALSFSILLGLGLFTYLMSDIPNNAYLSAWYYFQTWLFDGLHSTIEVSKEYLSHTHHLYSTTQIPIHQVAALTAPITHQLLAVAYAKLIQALYFSGISFMTILIFFFYSWNSE
jgi:hypothetical protein